MTAVFCVNAADRTAETWEKQLAPFGRLEYAVSGAAQGITKAVTDIAAARRDGPDAPALEHGPDAFHTTLEATRILSQHWRRAEAAWEKAEAADVAIVAAKRKGVDARGAAGAARAAWRRATATFEQAERLEAAWGRAHAALELFTPAVGSTTAPKRSRRSPRPRRNWPARSGRRFGTSSPTRGA